MRVPNVSHWSMEDLVPNNLTNSIPSWQMEIVFQKFAIFFHLQPLPGWCNYYSELATSAVQAIPAQYDFI